MQEIKGLSKYRRSLRERILSAAMEAFTQEGIKAVRMDDISKMLNISKRTLYEIYENKEVLLYEGISSFRKQQESALQQMAAEKDNVMDIILSVYRIRMDEFRQTNPKFFSDIEKYPSVVDYLRKIREQNQKQLSEFLNRGISEGFFREDLDYGIVIPMFDVFGQTVMQKRMYERFSMDSIFKNILFVSLRGICTLKGIEALDKFLDIQTER